MAERLVGKDSVEGEGWDGGKEREKPDHSASALSSPASSPMVETMMCVSLMLQSLMVPFSIPVTNH